MAGGIGVVVFIVVVVILSSIKVLNEYERAVIFRLGRLLPERGPGIIIVLPVIEKWVRMDLRVSTLDIAPQDVITRDNVSAKLSAVLYFRVIDASKAVIEVSDFRFATRELALTTLRATCGQHELDELLSQREMITLTIQNIIDQHTEPWGIKVVLVELRNIDLPQDMQRAIARQAEAERERRAKVIAAEGEFQAAQRLSEAADIMGNSPITLQLRYLQTLSEIATENASTTIFPLPIDLIEPFLRMRAASAASPTPPDGTSLKPK
ncbi:MAG TPA: slipin family protein [Candidatus Binataceae bacterium]|nr:slipin family protein [Candidatus Binataceae bacterium]